jgi:hypothetical protein
LKDFAPSLYSNDNMSSFLGDFESLKLRSDSSSERIDTFDRLEQWLDSEISDAEENERQTLWRSHHVQTARKARKLLMSLPERCGGLLTRGRAKPTDDVSPNGWRHGQVVVVDIAGLDTMVQAAVIARTCSRLLRAAENEELGLDHLVLFADELNMFAPATGGEMDSVKKVLRKISATGRYAGMSLWGAAQFLSQVDAQILGNAATRAVGIISDGELDSGVYGRMPAGQRERLVTLPKGQIALKAYNLRGQLVVQFPRPGWATGKAKVTAADAGPGGSAGRNRTATAALGLSAQSVTRLTEGVAPDVVERVIARVDGDPARAAAELGKLREPDMAKVSVERGSTYDPDNPWDLE